ncbi:TRAP transporter small permease subunit [Frigidibacter sp. MR17.14]|uniref:TRAP transporter small permease n=1 Tax=Frigidibacter sp. MR17.14 TaxID=3126509 RepID=UPI0030131BD1
MSHPTPRPAAAGPTPPLVRLYRAYCAVVRSLVGTAMLALVAIMMAQVLARYVFGGSLIWAEELCRYILIWITFLSLGLAWDRGEFVALDLLTGGLAQAVQLAIRTVLAVPILWFLWLIGSSGLTYALRFKAQTIPAIDFIWTNLTGGPAGIPITYVYISVTVGCALLAAHVVAGLIVDMIAWRAGRQIHHLPATAQQEL